MSARGRTRTSDTRFRKPVLYPLSYAGGEVEETVSARRAHLKKTKPVLKAVPAVPNEPGHLSEKAMRLWEAVHPDFVLEHLEVEMLGSRWRASTAPPRHARSTARGSSSSTATAARSRTRCSPSSGTPALWPPR
jgi:hypothetical protein